jgi:hypothetical protein
MVVTSGAARVLRQNAIRYQEREIGQATPEGFIDGSTLRAFRPKPLPKQVIRPLFNVFGDRLENFIRSNPSPTRVAFDKFHAGEVNDFHASIIAGGVVSEAKAGDLPEGGSYNVYAKVLNLIHTHWCHRPAPGHPNGRHPIGSAIDSCLHIPIDKRVVDGVKPMVISGNLPRIPAPMFARSPKMSNWIAMCSIRTKENYDAFQAYFRAVADPLGLTPVEAFEGFW